MNEIIEETPKGLPCIASDSFSSRKKEVVPTIEEVKGFSVYLKDVFVSCKTVQWDGHLLTIEEAYSHVYKDKGGCERCKKIFERIIENLKGEDVPTLNELRDFESALEATYFACRDQDSINQDDVSVQDAYQHIYVINGGCKQCQSVFEEKKQHIEKFCEK